MSVKEKLDMLDKHVMGLFSQDNREGARACIALWEQLIQPEITADERTVVEPRLAAMRALLGSV